MRASGGKQPGWVLRDEHYCHAALLALTQQPQTPSARRYSHKDGCARFRRWQKNRPAAHRPRRGNELLSRKRTDGLFLGCFDGGGEGLLLVRVSIRRSLAPSFLERMQRVVQDFAQQHQADQKLADKDREGYTLLLAMRSWKSDAFLALRRSVNEGMLGLSA